MALTAGESAAAIAAIQGIVGATTTADVPLAQGVAIAATEEFVNFKAVTGNVSAANGVVDFVLPYAATFLGVAANVKTAGAGIVAFDAKKGSTSLHTTTPTIDASETSTATAATPAVVKTDSTITFAAGDRFVVDISSVNAGTPVDFYVSAKFRRLS